MFFTSDSHFNHARILDYCGESRSGIGTVDQMNQLLIERWNAKVCPTDLVYHLGDFAFGKVTDWIDLLLQLNGRIHLIPGNHDHRVLNNTRDRSILENSLKNRLTIEPLIKEIEIKNQFQDPNGFRNKTTIILSHYPILSWHKKYYGSIHLHGHCHATLTYDVRALDIGVDARPQGDLAPWSWDEVSSYIDSRMQSNEFLIRNQGLKAMHRSKSS